MAKQAQAAPSGRYLRYRNPQSQSSVVIDTQADQQPFQPGVYEVNGLHVQAVLHADGKVFAGRTRLKNAKFLGAVVKR